MPIATATALLYLFGGLYRLMATILLNAEKVEASNIAIWLSCFHSEKPVPESYPPRNRKMRTHPCMRLVPVIFGRTPIWALIGG